MGKGAGSGEGWGESDTKGGHGEWKHGLCGSCSPVGDCKCAKFRFFSKISINIVSQSSHIANIFFILVA